MPMRTGRLLVVAAALLGRAAGVALRQSHALSPGHPGSDMRAEAHEASGEASEIGSETLVATAPETVEKNREGHHAMSQSEFENSVRKCGQGKEARRAIRMIDEPGLTKDSEKDPVDTTKYSEARSGMNYMRDTWCVLKAFAPDATSMADIGSSWPPFMRSVEWVKGTKAVISKYFPGPESPSELSRLISCPAGVKWSYDEKDGWINKGGDPHPECQDRESSIKVFMEDFGAWVPSQTFDIVMSSQVLEHIPDPKPFLQKMLSAGKWVVVSVPYKWPKDTEVIPPGAHKQHEIDLAKIRDWAGGQKEVYSFVSREPKKESPPGADKRIVVVFKGSPAQEKQAAR